MIIWINGAFGGGETDSSLTASATVQGMAWI